MSPLKGVSEQSATIDYDRNYTTKIPLVEILERVEENPGLSSRHLSLEVRVSKDTVNRALREQLLHPFHLRTVQNLLPFDLESRQRFCQFINERRAHI